MHSEVTVDQRVGKNLPGQGDINPAGLIERPTHGSHLGQRSSDRTARAGHMTASDHHSRTLILLAKRGPSTHDPATHVFLSGISASKTWTPGSNPGEGRLPEMIELRNILR